MHQTCPPIATSGTTRPGRGQRRERGRRFGHYARDFRRTASRRNRWCNAGRPCLSASGNLQHASIRKSHCPPGKLSSPSTRRRRDDLASGQRGQSGRFRAVGQGVHAAGRLPIPSRRTIAGQFACRDQGGAGGFSCRGHQRQAIDGAVSGWPRQRSAGHAHPRAHSR